MINQWVGAEANVAVAAVPAPADGLQGQDEHARRGGRLAGLRDRRGRRHPRELGPPRPREEVHHRQEGRRPTPARTASPGSSAGTSRGWMVDEYPDITDWNNLNKYADLFKTSESGDKGQFLGSRPDVRPVRRGPDHQPRLNYKVVFSGSEAATITAFQQADKNKTPLIGYFYDPQWLLSRGQARQGQPAAVHGGLRRGPQEGRLRLPGLHPEQDRPDEVAGGGRATPRR